MMMSMMMMKRMAGIGRVEVVASKRTGHWWASRRAMSPPPRRALKIQGALVAILVEVMAVQRCSQKLAQN